MKSDRLIVHNTTLKWGTRTYVMGILNITVDSFSGDGILSNLTSLDGKQQPNSQTLTDLAVNTALAQAQRYIDAGVDILDVGGESTRPGSQPLAADEEMERVLPVIKSLASKFDVLLSIDSYKSEVAEAGIKAGAHIINDVWALRADPSLATIAARYQVPLILMHNRSSWVHAEILDRLGGRYVGMEYENLLEDVKRELMESVQLAHEAGVADERIILDPGIGFGKTVEQNLELIDRLGEIRDLGYPVLLGPSRKSFIGYTLDLPTDQRVEGTAAAVAVGISRGADVVRVHDVEYMVRVVKMTDAIVRRKVSA